MFGTFLLAAVVTMPTPEDVRALIKEDFYCSSRAHSLSDECEFPLEFTPKEVRDLTCHESKWPREFACSYNVLIEERYGLYPSYWMQRVDQFRLMDDGTWFLVQELSPPRPASLAASASLP